MSDRFGIEGNGGAFSSLCAGMYYGPEATSTKSGNITVAAGETIWVHAQNLLEGECIVVRQVIGNMCVPYYPLPGVELMLDECTTSIALGVEGTYALELDPPEALGRVSVVTNINCGTAGYMSWLASYQENSMPKQIPASQVTIEDQGNCFTAATVEGALAELAQASKDFVVVSDNTLTGDGTTASPLSAVQPSAGDGIAVAPAASGGTTVTFDPAGLTAAQLADLCAAIYPDIHAKLINFNGGTGEMHIDCNGDGNPFT